jgi:NAD(P)-dependent dehydrogenase (short-subunit alcohol dehydrogenase family)
MILQGTVVACCRSPDSATALNEFISSLDDPSRIQVVSLDVEDQASIESASLIIKEKFGRVDMLLNNAGILGDGKATPGPERSLAGMDRAWLEKSMAVNLTGPVMLSKELSPLMMQRRKKKKNPDEEERAIAVIANVSAGVGSISDNEIGGWYSYRMSKAALNQATRTMALELKRQSTWTVSLYPGMADTDLSKPFQSKNLKEGFIKPVDFTVGKLLDIVDSMNEESSGGFYDWSGQALSF